MHNGRNSFNASISRAGFTLVEAVISCLVVGIALVPAMNMIGAAAKARQNQSDFNQGMALAKDLLNEVMECRYTDPDGREAGETRATWDDVADYDSLTDKPPSAKDGTPLADAMGWMRQVRVGFVIPATPAIASPLDLGLRLITVTVTSPTGKTYTLSALRSSNGASDRVQTTSSDYTSAVHISLQPSGGTTMSATVDMVNQLP